MTREPIPTDGLEAWVEVTPAPVMRVDAVGLPAVMALARAARDVVDHAEQIDDPPGEWGVRGRDLDALRAAVEPIYPGPAT